MGFTEVLIILRLSIREELSQVFSRRHSKNFREEFLLTGAVPRLDILFRFAHKIPQSGFNSSPERPSTNKNNREDSAVFISGGILLSFARTYFENETS